ncbi:MAG TPA: lipid-A-disaccharide synthase [Rhizobiaceae bacterium]|nr:lipid-A-disaccharide synthase [Rhizobiaceae bacterium]
MSGGEKPIKLGIVAGEESGELLGADLVRALKAATGRPVELVGVGGRHLQDQGLKTLFDPADIALMGISAVLMDLPRLIRRIGTTARSLAEAKPDCVVTIDSPEFSLRVAKKLRALDPAIPIVHYVCPSVWAWRSGRAKAMKPHVDHVLCLLPFEPKELGRLGGPPGTFVGHRLSRHEGVLLAADMQARRLRGGEQTLLLLPGSRRGEVKALLGAFREAVSILAERGHRPKLLLPTVPHVQELVRTATADWPTKPEILSGDDAKWRAFGEADAAIAASGTVTLELALVGVPLISCYKFDAIARIALKMVSIWSASLPNLIADRFVVPEYYQEFIRPGHMARTIESLLADTANRRWQLEGFAEVRKRLSTQKPSGEMAADVVLKAVGSRQ